MSELDMFGFIGMNRSVFATFFLCGVLLPLAAVIIAYLFSNFPTTDFLTSAGMPIGETINPPGWMMALSLAQVVINLVLTVYVFLLAKWDNS